jgi:predicted nucleic-acid-binding protein
MRVTVDTNLLIRAAVRDDAKQAAAAEKILRESEIIAVTLPCLCEFVWVLRRVYRLGTADIHAAVAADAGMAMLDAGGDFADGLIAFEGQWLGGETFVSFDKRAVGLLKEQGQTALLLA